MIPGSSQVLIQTDSGATRQENAHDPNQELNEEALLGRFKVLRLKTVQGATVRFQNVSVALVTFSRISLRFSSDSTRAIFPEQND